MEKLDPSVAQQIAQAAITFQQKRTGHEPQSVAVVLSGDTLLITLQGALSPAEKALAQSPEGAAQLQEFHRQLFASSADELRQEIKRITGVDVREATTEVELKTGTVVQVFTTGTMVQVFCSLTVYLRTVGAGTDQARGNKKRTVCHASFGEEKSIMNESNKSVRKRHGKWLSRSCMPLEPNHKISNRNSGRHPPGPPWNFN